MGITIYIYIYIEISNIYNHIWLQSFKSNIGIIIIMSKCFDHRTTFPDTHRHFRPATEISRMFPIVCRGLELKNSFENRGFGKRCKNTVVYMFIYTESYTEPHRSTQKHQYITQTHQKYRIIFATNHIFIFF